MKQSVLQTVLNSAKTNLSRDGFLTPVGLLFKNDQLIAPILLKSDGPSFKEAMTYNAMSLGNVARKIGADCVVMVNDACMKSYPEGTDLETIGEENMPTTFPKSMRREVIIVVAIEVPDGKTRVLMQNYKGGDGESVEFLENDVPEDSAIKTRFTELVLTGYRA